MVGSTVRRITVMRGGAIGDFVVTLPVLDILKRLFPDALLTLIGNPDTLRLASAHQRIDHNTAAMAPLFANSPSLPKKSRTFFEKADLAIVYTTDTSGPFSGHLRRMCADRVVIQDPRPIPGDCCHISDHLLRALRNVDTTIVESPDPSIPAEAVDEAYARNLFSGMGYDRPLLLHPGSGGVDKRWALCRFLELADCLVSAGHQVGLLAGPAEEEALVGTCVKRGFLAVRPPNLRSLAGVLAATSLYVGNDSGPTHMAAALGVATVALFGPTDPRVWGPRGRRVLTVTARDGRMCSIATEDVRAATEQILGDS